MMAMPFIDTSCCILSFNGDFGINQLVKNMLFKKLSSTLKLFFTVLIVTAMTVQTGWSQQRSGQRNCKQPYSRNFDTGTVETLKGEVSDVIIQTGQNNLGTCGVHLLLKSGESTIPVHLGPVWYMEEQESSFSQGQQITVTGSRIKLDGRYVIIASKVERGDMVLELRDEDGFPKWRGWRRLGRM